MDLFSLKFVMDVRYDERRTPLSIFHSHSHVSNEKKLLIKIYVGVSILWHFPVFHTANIDSHHSQLTQFGNDCSVIW